MNNMCSSLRRRHRHTHVRPDLHRRPPRMSLALPSCDCRSLCSCSSAFVRCEGSAKRLLYKHWGEAYGCRHRSGAALHCCVAMQLCIADAGRSILHGACDGTDIAAFHLPLHMWRGIGQTNQPTHTHTATQHTQSHSTHSHTATHAHTYTCKTIHTVMYNAAPGGSGPVKLPLATK